MEAPDIWFCVIRAVAEWRVRFRIGTNMLEPEGGLERYGYAPQPHCCVFPPILETTGKSDGHHCH